MEDWMKGIQVENCVHQINKRQEEIEPNEISKYGILVWNILPIFQLMKNKSFHFEKTNFLDTSEFDNRVLVMMRSWKGEGQKKRNEDITQIINVI